MGVSHNARIAMVLKTSDYVIIVIKWLLTIITIGGNLTTIIIILRKKKLRNRPDTRFMLSLAAADMAVGFFVMVPGIFYIMNDSYWPFGVLGCKLWVSVDVTFCSASIYSL